MKKKRPELGFAIDFLRFVGANAKAIKEKKVKIIVNAGGLNPQGCRDALLMVLQQKGIDLRVSAVCGDDLMPVADTMRDRGAKDMFTGSAFPSKETTLSANAYLGATPIAAALARGADIIVTGRVVDSALVLGPLMHEFGWKGTDYDLLAQGTLAGHLVECGAQGTGGLFTDWKSHAWENIAYPIVTVSPNGEFVVSKLAEGNGTICPGSIAEQALYEIHDPAAYHVPDVAADFTGVSITTTGEPNTVLVRGARGRPPTNTLKVAVVAEDGWAASALILIVGDEAVAKAEKTAAALLSRSGRLLKASKLPPFAETRVEVLGGGNAYRGIGHPPELDSREVVLRLSVRHANKKAVTLFGTEIAVCAVGMAQGSLPLAPPRSGLRPVFRFYSILVPKEEVQACIIDAASAGEPVAVAGALAGSFPGSPSRPMTSDDPEPDAPTGEP